MSNQPEPTEADSRRRHPCGAWTAPTAPLATHLRTEVAAAGAPHAAVAAAVVEARGRSGLDRSTFAARAGVEVVVLESAEAGLLSRDQLPGALRRMVPMPEPVTPTT